MKQVLGALQVLTLLNLLAMLNLLTVLPAQAAPALSAPGATAPSLSAPASTTPAWADRHPGLRHDDIRAIGQQEWTTVIVELETGSTPAPSAQEQNSAKSGEPFQPFKHQLFQQRDSNRLRAQREFSHLPMTAVQIRDATELAALAQSPLVKAIYSNEKFYTSLTQSLTLIDQTALTASHIKGSGQSVVIIDTGLNYTRAEFGSCTAPGTPASCRVPYATDIATSDGALDDNGHGTHVSAIAASVAPGASVIGLDVYASGTASSVDIISALNWAIANQTVYNIVAINISLAATSVYASPCSAGNPFVTPVANAKTAGILTVMAAGNAGNSGAIAIPACTPGAVSVGAVYDANVGSVSWSPCTDSTTAADKVACFSNSANFLTLLAPGAMITTAGMTMGGTSQASPHVAGAVALLAQAYPADSPDLRLSRLTGYGVPVLDTRNSISKPRLDLTAFIPPLNDSFASATPISNSSGTQSLTNLNASGESGEPDHAGATGGASIWLEWTATETTHVFIDTLGSSIDTLLAVYQGDDVTTLAWVASNDDMEGATTSALDFYATAGTTYRIAIDGKNGAQGSITLNWSSVQDHGADIPFLPWWGYMALTGLLMRVRRRAVTQSS